ncbi:MAG: hypothetical protein JWL77_3469 [Chthonomonadaceae bacterium]|nr:hypothetical protein [Chthonomonadaceae bacterium]
MATMDKEKSKGGRPILIVLPYLILVGLLAAPPTRTLLQTQLRMLHNIAPFLARIREMGVREGPSLPAPTWKESPTAASVACFPDDYSLQLGGVLLAGTYIDIGRPMSPQERFDSFQRRYGEHLAALATRFPDRPGPYAHMLRFMTGSAVRLSRDAEVEVFQTGQNPNGLSDRPTGYADSWEAFDQAAAQGEKLDPDNAYFPMMRAMGFFDAKRDAEGIAAVLRAGQKSRFDDYSQEEVEAEWKLYLRSYGPSSMLVRQSISASVLLPHFAPLRATGRLTAYLAEKEEQQGRTQEGLALRHAMMQCGVLMRDQSSIIGALVGTAIVPIQTNLPGGKRYAPAAIGVTDEQKHDVSRDRYLGYLHKIGAEDEARWFAAVDARDRQVRTIIETAGKAHLLDGPAAPLPALWMLDMLLLTNMLAMLLLCTAAVVCTRLPGGEKALPVVVVLLAVLCLLIALPMQWAEALTQIRLVLDNLSGSGWQRPASFDISGLVTRFPGVIHVGEVILSLLIPALTLPAFGVVSLIRREAFTVALSRGLQRGALVVATLLTVVYAGALIATAQAETRVGAALDGIMPNGVVTLQHRIEKDRKP